MISGTAEVGRAARLWEAALVTALFGLAALAWVATAASSSPGMRQGILSGGGFMPMGTGAGAPSAVMLVLFLWMWIVMMVAMMFPALVPVVVTFDRWVRRTRRSRSSTVFFVGGYLLTWGGAGLLVYAAIVYLGPLLPSGQAGLRLGAGLLVLAGAYQFTSLKGTCLQHCRSPLAFLAHHASRLRRGGLESTRVGAVHGAFCVGCCWALMLVLVLLGMMSLVWMGAVAGMIFLEKVFPRSWPVRQVVGLLLVGVGFGVLLSSRGLPAFA